MAKRSLSNRTADSWTSRMGWIGRMDSSGRYLRHGGYIRAVSSGESSQEFQKFRPGTREVSWKYARSSNHFDLTDVCRSGSDRVGYDLSTWIEVSGRNLFTFLILQSSEVNFDWQDLQMRDLLPGELCTGAMVRSSLQRCQAGSLQMVTGRGGKAARTPFLRRGSRAGIHQPVV